MPIFVKNVVFRDSFRSTSLHSIFLKNRLGRQFSFYSSKQYRFLLGVEFSNIPWCVEVVNNDFVIIPSLYCEWGGFYGSTCNSTEPLHRPRHLPRHLPAHGGPWVARSAAAAPAGGHTSWRSAWIVRDRWSGYAPSTLAGARGCRAAGAARRALRRRPGDAARAVRGGDLSTWPAHILMSWMKLRWSSSMYLEAMLRAESSSSRQLEPESTSVVEPRSAPAGPKAAASAY